MRINFLDEKMLNIILDYMNKHGFFSTLKKIWEQLNPKAIISFYVFTKGIVSRDYAYTGPDCVQIDLTNACNDNCIGCWCNSPLLRERTIGLQAKSKMLPDQLVKDFIDEIYRMGTRKIVFSGGGEPLMHPNALDILGYAKKKGMACQLHTNFTLADVTRIRRIIEMRLDFLTISLWAGTAKTYKITHPNKGEEAFYRTREMLTFLSVLRKKRKEPFVRLHNVITNLNYTEIDQMAYLAREVGADAVSFAPIDAISGYTDSLLLSNEQRKGLLNACVSLRKEGGVRLFDFDEFMRKVSSADAVTGDYDKDIIDSIPCYAGWLFARLNADGSVNSCLKSHRIPIGNIYSKRFSEIWNSEKQREFRRMTRRFKKEGPYFSLIGNEPSAEVGCRRGCDDFGTNIRMHRKLAMASPFLNLMGRSVIFKK